MMNVLSQPRHILYSLIEPSLIISFLMKIYEGFGAEITYGEIE
jgi:hypothetical protein